MADLSLTGIIMTPFEIIGRLAGLVREARSSSLIDYTQPTRVEPIVMIDETLRYQTWLPDVLQTASSIYSGYYLQAVGIAAQLSGVRAVAILDPLSTKRDPLNSFADSVAATFSGLSSLESMSPHNSAPASDPYSMRLPNYTQVSVESVLSAPSTSEVGTGRNSSPVGETVNLAVGKVLEVVLSIDDQKVTVPVTVRLQPVVVNPSAMATIMSVGDVKNTAKERYHRWRAGELKLIDDLLLCNDLIDEYRKTRMTDTSGIYKEVMNRRRSNRLAGFLSGNPSVGTASTMAVFSVDTAREIEAHLGGRLTNPTTRQRVFVKTSTMIFLVVDPGREVITIYHRNIGLPTELHLRELKALNKGTGPDVSEILKAYQLGQAPSF